MNQNTYSPLHTILTTAKREIQILFSKKSVIIRARTPESGHGDLITMR